MKNEDQEHAQEQREAMADMGTSLGYDQGMDYQYLNPTRPIRLKGLLRGWKGWRKGRSAQAGALQARAGQAERRMSISSAALIITISIIVSRCLGLLRSSLFTAVLGASGFTDAYNQAFIIPNLIFNIVAGGALMSAFIPVFQSYMVEKADENTAWYVASMALNLALAAMAVLALVAIVLADKIVLLYNYNAPLPQSQLVLITMLTRIMLVQSVIMGAGVIVNAVLNARQHFLLPAIGSALYPVGMIIGLLPGFVLVLLHRRDDMFAIYSATWGVVLGACLMVGIQMPGLARVGMRYRFRLDWRHPGVLQIARQMAPRVVNAVMLNLSTVVDLMLVLMLVSVVGPKSIDGLYTIYMLAFTIMMIPHSGVMAVSTAAFPTMTEYATQGRLDRLRIIVSQTLRSVLFVSIPSSLGLILLSQPVVQMLYEHGPFTLRQVELTVVPLICFALGLPGLATVEILTRSFYALRDSKTPVMVSVWQFLFKIALSLLLIDPLVWCARSGIGSLLPTTLTKPLIEGAWGMGALALSTSIAVLLEAVGLLLLLHWRVGSLGLRALGGFIARVLLASLAMCLSLLLTRALLDVLLVTTVGTGDQTLSFVGLLRVAVKLLLSVGVGSFVYLRTARLISILGSQDLAPVNRLLARLRLSWI